MAILLSEIIPIAALVVSLGGYISQRFGVILDIQKQLGVISERISKQEMKMDTLWPSVTDAVKEMLKHPTASRKDDLLDRFPKLSTEEMCKLRDTLMVEKHDMLTELEYAPADKKMYALALALMLAGIDTILIDRGLKC